LRNLGAQRLHGGLDLPHARHEDQGVEGNAQVGDADLILPDLHLGPLEPELSVAAEGLEDHPGGLIDPGGEAHRPFDEADGILGGRELDLHDLVAEPPGDAGEALLHPLHGGRHHREGAAFFHDEGEGQVPLHLAQVDLIHDGEDLREALAQDVLDEDSGGDVGHVHVEHAVGEGMAAPHGVAHAAPQDPPRPPRQLIDIRVEVRRQLVDPIAGAVVHIPRQGDGGGPGGDRHHRRLVGPRCQQEGDHRGFARSRRPFHQDHDAGSPGDPIERPRDAIPHSCRRTGSGLRCRGPRWAGGASRWGRGRDRRAGRSR
jgi:hypothetical protein